MVQAADMLARWGEPRGDGIGVVAPSGGGMSVMADRLMESGLRLSTLQASTTNRLHTLLRPAQANNPVDLGGRLSSDPIETAGRTMAALSADPDVSAIVIVVSAMPLLAEVTEALAITGLNSGKPTLAVVMPASAGERARETLRNLNCPFYDRMDDAIRVFKIWAEYWKLLRRPQMTRPERSALPPGADEAIKRMPAGRLTEPEAKTLVAAYGVRVNPGRMVTTREDAVIAAMEIGYPVALKAVSRSIVHKTRAGAVRLNLREASAVRTAFEEVTRAVQGGRPGEMVEGCVVQAMVSGDAEMIVGIRRDPQFGPIVLVGAGGMLADILNDIQIAGAPVSADRALDLLRALRIWPALTGFGGRGRLNVEEVAQTVSRMSWLAVDLGERLVDLEANPVIVGPADTEAVVVDARGTLRAEVIG
jgi:acetyl-CoA synthetase (ADP-forming)